MANPNRYNVISEVIDNGTHHETIDLDIVHKKSTEFISVKIDVSNNLAIFFNPLAQYTPILTCQFVNNICSFQTIKFKRAVLLRKLCIPGCGKTSARLIYCGGSNKLVSKHKQTTSLESCKCYKAVLFVKY